MACTEGVERLDNLDSATYSDLNSARRNLVALSAQDPADRRRTSLLDRTKFLETRRRRPRTTTNAVVAVSSFSIAILWAAVEDAAPVTKRSLVTWDEVVMTSAERAVATRVYRDAERFWRGVGVVSARATWAPLALVASNDSLLQWARIRVVIVRVAVIPVDARAAGWWRGRHRWWWRGLGPAVMGFLCSSAVRHLQCHGVRHHAREAL